MKSFRIARSLEASTLSSPVIPFHNPLKGIPVPLDSLPHFVAMQLVHKSTLCHLNHNVVPIAAV